LQSDNYALFETVSLVVMVVILLADLLIVGRKVHVPSAKESALWVTFYALLAVGFGFLLLNLFGQQIATEFFAGWLTEYSLSIDNLFVFIIIMSRFAVPLSCNKKFSWSVLSWRWCFEVFSSWLAQP
jgi:tellurite resistance protein TerC